MLADVETLPWSALTLSDPDIPWESLRALAAAAAESADVRKRLQREYNEITARFRAKAPFVEPDLRDLGVSAVFALAAEKMDEAVRHECAVYLLQKIYEAGEADDEFSLEVLPTVLRGFGTSVVRPTIDMIEEQGIGADCWLYVLRLLGFARDMNSSIRENVIRLCRRIIRNAPDRFEKWTSATWPAHVLADLGDTGSLPLLRSLFSLSHDGDLELAIRRLEGTATPDDDFDDDVCGKSVDEWLPRRIEQFRGWFEKRSIENEGGCTSGSETAPDGIEDDNALDPRDSDGSFDAPAWDGPLPLNDPSLDNPDDSYVTNPIHRETSRIGRNDPCICGSGKKYKKCCGR